MIRKTRNKCIEIKFQLTEEDAGNLTTGADEQSVQTF